MSPTRPRQKTGKSPLAREVQLEESTANSSTPTTSVATDPSVKSSAGASPQVAKPLFYKEADLAIASNSSNSKAVGMRGVRAQSEPLNTNSTKDSKWKASTITNRSAIRKRTFGGVKKVSFAKSEQVFSHVTRSRPRTADEVFREKRRARNLANSNKFEANTKDGRNGLNRLLGLGHTTVGDGVNHGAALAAVINNTGVYVPGRAEWLKVYAALTTLFAAETCHEIDRAWTGLWFSLPCGEQFLSLRDYNECVREETTLPEEPIWHTMTGSATRIIAEFALRVLRDNKLDLKLDPDASHGGRPTILDPKRFGPLKLAASRQWTSSLEKLVKQQKEARGPERGINHPCRWGACHVKSQRLDKKIQKHFKWVEKEKWEKTFTHLLSDRLDEANDSENE